MRKWVNFLRLNVLEHLLEYAGALPPSSWSTLVKVAQEMHALAVAPPAEPAFAAENVATLHSKLSPTLTRVMLKVWLRAWLPVCLMHLMWLAAMPLLEDT